MNVLYWGTMGEALTCANFLSWQRGYLIRAEENRNILEIFPKGGTFIYIEGKLIAIGLRKLIEYWDKNGLWLL